ncbi:MAG: phage head-tail adapter protein [Burkholderiales bacterium]|nr:phage head-tail adapter protein [Burkholderiales bacterium]
MTDDKRDLLVQRLGMLKTERSGFDSHWKSVSEFLLPRSGRFFVTDRNRNGASSWNKIIDSTATRAAGTLAAGMMAGMTSPARPWFRLGTPDPELNTFAPVKQWLDDVRKLLLMVFAKSNTYRSLHAMYKELGVFGTSGSVVLPDFDKVLHHYPQTVGQFFIAQNAQGVVDTMYREFQMTVGQMVKEFGEEKCSRTVREAFKRGNLDHWMTVIHAIEPREDRDLTKRDARNMPFRSCYFEPACDPGKYLRESGFQRFRALAPRWEVTGEDIYGTTCPGMEALGDTKQLQHQQLRKGQVIDYKTNPPLQVPVSMQNNPVGRLPGGVTYVTASSATQSVQTLFNVDLDLSHLREDIVDVRARINSAFYADLFLMLASQPANGRMTATEVAERHEEKLLMLGPTLERLHNEMLSPMIDIAFDGVVAAGLVPPPPEELQGMELDVEFVSMLAQAQRAVATNGIDRFVGNLGAIAAFKPDVLDKFDADAWADGYSDMLGVDSDLIVANDKVARIREARAQQQQAMQQAAVMQQGAATAKDLATARSTDPDGVGSAIDQFSGYTTA